MTRTSGIGRRALLRAFGQSGALFAGTLATGAAAAAHGAGQRGLLLAGAADAGRAGTPAPSLGEPAMMVAGPSTSAAGALAQMLAPLLSVALGSRSLTLSAVGGRDGVTGANAYEALTNPDGATALLVPGAACIAWLAGDPRVHFDAGHWVPALTSFGSAALMCRDRPDRRFRSAAPLRVAASTPAGPELPALLGLSLLGIRAVPVFGLAEAADAASALHGGRVDAILLAGGNVPDRADALVASGLQPIFSLGTGSGDARDPALPGMPTLPELLRASPGGSPALLDAWRATAAAARLHVALVLPQLTPASLVALWRGACRTAAQDSASTQAAGRAQLTILPAPDCVAALATMVAGENTLLALRRWLASRTDWRPA